MIDRSEARDFAQSRRRNRRLPIVERCEARILLSTIEVSNTNDSGLGSFREAITDSNANPAPLGQSNLIDFEIGVGIQVIHPTSALPTITASVAIDTTVSMVGTGQVIELQGDQAGPGADGLLIEGSGVVINGLDIVQFAGSGIRIEGGGSNVVEASEIGLDASGLEVGNAGNGLTIENSTGNTVGGNVISNNLTDGIAVLGVGSTGEVIAGNDIGTDASGTKALPNTDDGVIINQSSSNTIGAVGAGSGNVISGNGINGLELVNTVNNVVQGNSIGTDISGTKRLDNGQDGLILEGSSNNMIGGTLPNQGNLISGNQSIGVAIFGPPATGNLLVGNSIGVDRSGEATLANLGVGVYLFNAAGNSIGGTATGDGNVISGNGLNGLEVVGAGSSGEVIQGNIVGLDRSGTKSLGNFVNGIVLNNASDDTIGGTAAGDGNVISGNTENGVEILVTTPGLAATNDAVEGNFIGTDIKGTGVLVDGSLFGPGNLRAGVLVDGTVGNTSDNTIGGTAAGAGNVISSNSSSGIEFVGRNTFISHDLNAQASDGLIAGNIIGLDASGRQRMGNNGSGVAIRFADGILVGGVQPSARNVISANFQAGIQITQANDELVQGNIIGGDSSGVSGVDDLGNLDGIAFSIGMKTTIGGTTAGAGNVIFGNEGSGIALTLATENLILGNLIGPNILGSTVSGSANVDGSPRVLGNRKDGISLNSSTFNTIGGSTDDARNIISGNLNNGITLINTSDDNLIQGNYVGLDPTGLVARGNLLNGIYITTSDNTVGGLTPGSVNVVSGNLNSGVVLSTSAANNNFIAGNLIGTDAFGGVNPDGSPPQVGSDTLPIGNRQDGVFVNDDATGNTIGGTSALDGNVISGNGSNGVQFLGINVNANLAAGDFVEGNLIGTDALGLNADGNAANGVFFYNARNNVASSNEISGNLGSGLAIQGESATGNLVFNNLIGTNAKGTIPIGNDGDGVTIAEAVNNQIGGIGAGEGNRIIGNGGTGVSVSSNADNSMVAGNVIGGNAGDGVALSSGSNDSVVAGNKIGVDISGEIPIGNKLDGVRLADVGVGSQVVSNVISSNLGAGVEVSGLSSTAVIQGNLIGLDTLGTTAFGNAIGVLIGGVTDIVVGGTLANQGNYICGNGVGIQVTPPSSDSSIHLNDLIAGNTIGLDVSGNKALGNVFGVFLNDSVGVTIGGLTPDSQNIISGNSDAGIQVFRVSPGGSGDLIEGNIIGLNSVGLAVPMGAIQPIGVFLNTASNNTIGGTVDSARNVISGNSTGNSSIPSYGISIFGQSNAEPLDNVIDGNEIGTAINRIPLLDDKGAPIQTVGIAINVSSGNMIGGMDTSTRNTIEGNVVGVQLAGKVEVFPGLPIGNAILGDTIDGNSFGIFINGAAGNAILGDDLSMNTLIGLSITGADSTANTATGDRFFGNGSVASGAPATSTVGDGVYISGAIGNTIQANVIQANGKVGNPGDGVGVYIFDNASGNKINRNTIMGNTAYGILVYNSATNLSTIPRTGLAMNTISGSGIASFREFTGPVTTTVPTSKTKTKVKSAAIPRGLTAHKSIHR